MRLRVLTYNIHKCFGGLDRRYSPQRIVDTIAHYAPDIVCLQEVDAAAHRTQLHRQVDLLGDALGMRHRAWFENVRLRSGGGYGNAVLSRHALVDVSNIDLTIPPKKRRSALHVRCRVRVGPGQTRSVHVFCVHLGLAEFERRLQLRKLFASEAVRRLHGRTPAIVAGDLNDVWAALGPRLFAPEGFTGPARSVATFPAYAPLRALDGVYARGELRLVHVDRARLALARAASDHLPLVADFELRAASPAAGSRAR